MDRPALRTDTAASWRTGSGTQDLPVFGGTAQVARLVISRIAGQQLPGALAKAAEASNGSATKRRLEQWGVGEARAGNQPASCNRFQKKRAPGPSTLSLR